MDCKSLPLIGYKTRPWLRVEIAFADLKRGWQKAWAQLPLAKLANSIKIR